MEEAGATARRGVVSPELCESIQQVLDARGYGAADVGDLVLGVIVHHPTVARYQPGASSEDGFGAAKAEEDQLPSARQRAGRLALRLLLKLGAACPPQLRTCSSTSERPQPGKIAGATGAIATVWRAGAPRWTPPCSAAWPLPTSGRSSATSAVRASAPRLSRISRDVDCEIHARVYLSAAPPARP